MLKPSNVISKGLDSSSVLVGIHFNVITVTFKVRGYG